jgi:hypothetical protein
MYNVVLLSQPLWLLAAGCLLLNFDMTTTTHKLQVNKHTTMKIEVVVEKSNTIDLSLFQNLADTTFS